MTIIRRPRPGFNWLLAGWALCALVTGALYLTLFSIHLRTGMQSDRMLQAYKEVWPVLSLRVFGNLVLIGRYTGLLVFLAVAALIVWQRPRDRMGLIVALMLITLPMVFQLGGYSETWLAYPKAWRPVLNSTYNFITTVVGLPATIAFFFLFPTGRAEPRWLGRAGAGLTVALYALWLFMSWVPLSTSFDWPWLVFMLGAFTNIGLALWGQVYRYRRVSIPAERRQTRLVVVGLFVFVVGIFVQGGGLDGLLGLILGLTTLLWLPISLAISMLRYQLWDIEVVVRRTLVYAVLTGLLALVYFGAVVLLEAVARPLTGQSDNAIVSVLSTLAIAALFGPLRRRVQSFIDRRFYRRKYDAARIIEAFGGTLRAEAALEQVTAQLVAVAAATVQPSQVSVWLPTPPRSAVTPVPADRRGAASVL